MAQSRISNEPREAIGQGPTLAVPVPSMRRGVAAEIRQRSTKPRILAPAVGNLPGVVDDQLEIDREGVWWWFSRNLAATNTFRG